MTGPEHSPQVVGPGGLLLGEVLGRGGSGSTVYAATDPATGAARAVKVLPGLDPAARGRLLGEAAVAARVRHPGLVGVLDIGEVDGTVWLVLERVNGLDLQREVEQYGPLDPPEALALLTQVGHALAALHAAGIAHRDVTPSNVLVEGPPGARRARLTDAGLAGALTGSAGEAGRLSADTAWVGSEDGLGDVSGTAAWMSPEQWRGAAASAPGDVYAVGAVLHWLLTGRRPFRGTSLPLLAAAHVLGPRPVPSAVREGLPPGYDALVAHLTAVEPGERPADGAALVAVLEDLAAGRAMAPLAQRSESAGAESYGAGLSGAESPRAGLSGAGLSSVGSPGPGPAGARPPRAESGGGGRAGTGPAQAGPGAPRGVVGSRLLLPIALAAALAAALVTAAVLLMPGGVDEDPAAPAPAPAVSAAPAAPVVPVTPGAPVGPAAPVEREVCAREITVRDQPVRGSATVDTVPRGATLLVIGTRGSWSQVQRDDGSEAWVISEFLCP